MTDADDEGVTGLSPSVNGGTGANWSPSHPWFLRATGAKLELIMKKFVTENMPRPSSEKFRKRLLKNIKPAFWVVLPTNEQFDVMSFRQCGANRDFYEFAEKNRDSFVGTYVGQHMTFDPTSERENSTRAAIAAVNPESEIQVGTCVGKEKCVFAAHSTPLNIDGKICLIGCAITFLDRNFMGRDAGDSKRELALAVQALDFFKHNVSMTEDTMRYTRANLREYMLVDYPRKFIWHDSLFTVKNTFLNVTSSYAPKSSVKALTASESGSVDTSPSKLMYNATEDNFRVFDRICKDIGIMFGDRELVSGPVKAEGPRGFRGAYISPAYVDRWDAPGTGGPPSTTSSGTTRSGPSLRDKACGGYLDPELRSSSSMDTYETPTTASSRLLQSWTRFKIDATDHEDVFPSSTLSNDEASGMDLDFIVPRSRSAPSVGGAPRGASEDSIHHFAPLYLRNPSSPGASPQQSWDPRMRNHTATFVPATGFLRNPGAVAAHGYGSNHESGGGVDTSGAEGAGSKFHASDHSTRDSTKSFPRNDVTLDPSLKQPRKLKVGDRVELHSFPYATWLWGLRGRVKHVLVDKRRRNRERRITIEYDNPEYQEQKSYLKTIPVSNARLIGKSEK